MEFKDSWNADLPLVEFAYNNSFHSTIQMPLYEFLYGWSPLFWDDVEEPILGPYLVQEAGKRVAIIK